MKYLSRIVFGAALAGLLASCAVSGGPAATPEHVQTTPEALAIEANVLLERLAEIGKSIVYIKGPSVACACSPTVVPNRPGPPPAPWNPEDAKRGLQFLQAVETGYETNRLVTIRAAAQQGSAR
jgi:hypothetical protein